MQRGKNFKLKTSLKNMEEVNYLLHRLKTGK